MGAKIQLFTVIYNDDCESLSRVGSWHAGPMLVFLQMLHLSVVSRATTMRTRSRDHFISFTLLCFALLYFPIEKYDLEIYQSRRLDRLLIMEKKIKKIVLFKVSLLNLHQHIDHSGTSKYRV